MINARMTKAVLSYASSSKFTRFEIARILDIKYDQVRYILRKHKNNYVKKDLRVTPVHCKECKALTTNNIFCSHKCYNNYRIKTRLDNPNKTCNTRSVKKYLIRHAGKICAHCGTTHWENTPIHLHVFRHWEQGVFCLVCSNCYTFFKNSEKKYRQEELVLNKERMKIIEANTFDDVLKIGTKIINTGLNNDYDFFVSDSELKTVVKKATDVLIQALLFDVNDTDS